MLRGSRWPSSRWLVTSARMPSASSTVPGRSVSVVAVMRFLLHVGSHDGGFQHRQRGIHIVSGDDVRRQQANDRAARAVDQQAAFERGSHDGRGVESQVDAHEQSRSAHIANDRQPALHLAETLRTGEPMTRPSMRPVPVSRVLRGRPVPRGRRAGCRHTCCRDRRAEQRPRRRS